MDIVIKPKEDYFWYLLDEYTENDNYVYRMSSKSNGEPDFIRRLTETERNAFDSFVESIIEGHKKFDDRRISELSDKERDMNRYV